MIKEKKVLRAHYLKIRSALSKAEVEQKSRLVLQKIAGDEEIFEKKSFGIYLATKNEVETKPLISKLVSQNKDVFLPRFFENDKAYFFVKFSDWKRLEVGFYGILQPASNQKTEVKKLEAIFIPGIAFNKSGIRLGWGTGTYDQLLRGSKALKIGLAYDFQIADSLPYEKHDIKVDMIVTEKRVIRIDN